MAFFIYMSLSLQMILAVRTNIHQQVSPLSIKHRALNWAAFTALIQIIIDKTS